MWPSSFTRTAGPASVAAGAVGVVIAVSCVRCRLRCSVAEVLAPATNSHGRPSRPPSWLRTVTSTCDRTAPGAAGRAGDPPRNERMSDETPEPVAELAPPTAPPRENPQWSFTFGVGVMQLAGLASIGAGIIHAGAVGTHAE